MQVDEAFSHLGSYVQSGRPRESQPLAASRSVCEGGAASCVQRSSQRPAFHQREDKRSMLLLHAAAQELEDARMLEASEKVNLFGKLGLTLFKTAQTRNVNSQK